VDAAGRSLRISRALSAGEVKDTKTHETRDVDVTRRLAAALSQYQPVQEAEALAAGVEPPAHLFPEGRGLLDAERAARRFQAVLQRAGLPRFRLYDLRHSFASHLLAMGARCPISPPSLATPIRARPYASTPTSCRLETGRGATGSRP
jgi:integrase